MTLLTVTASTLIVSAEGQTNESSKIKFNALAAGSCYVIYGPGELPPIHPILYHGEGRGIASISGRAKDAYTSYSWFSSLLLF